MCHNGYTLYKIDGKENLKNIKYLERNIYEITMGKNNVYLDCDFRENKTVRITSRDTDGTSYTTDIVSFVGR